MKRCKAGLMGALAVCAIALTACDAIPGMGGNDTGESHVGDTLR